jgi:hypothetical protein
MTLNFMLQIKDNRVKKRIKKRLTAPIKKLIDQKIYTHKTPGSVDFSIL